MKYDLVLEGGGAKGMVFAGAMQAFEARGHKHGRLLGTSAGAIAATLLAVGYNSEEMLVALNEKVDGKSFFTTFMGVPGPFTEEEVGNSAIADFVRTLDIPKVPGFVEKMFDKALFKRLANETKYRHLFSMVESGGWFTADRFVEWMDRKLNTGDFNGQPRAFGDMTLSQLFATTGAQLGLIASDTTGRQILVLNHNTAPDLPVKFGVRMSMSIPFVWPEVEWQEEWGFYRGRDVTGHMVVDGGMLSNFPIELLVDRSPQVMAVMGDQESDAEVIGLLIDEKKEVPGAPTLHVEAQPDKKGVEWRGLNTIQRANRLVDTMTQAHDKQVIEVLEDIVVRLPALGYGTTEFDMSDERRQALVDAGRLVMEAFFDRPRERDLDGPSDSQIQNSAGRIARGILG